MASFQPNVSPQGQKSTITTGDSGKKKGGTKKNVSSGDGAPGISPPEEIEGNNNESVNDTQTSKTEGKSDNQKRAAQDQAKKQNKGGAKGATGKPDAGDGQQQPQKSKAELKAERRAIQEAQRAAKEAKKQEVASASAQGTTQQKTNTQTPKAATQKAKAPPTAGSGEKQIKKKPAQVKEQELTEEQHWALKEKEIQGRNQKMDNSILNLGYQYFHQHVVGANARCVALLTTLREVIAKYRTPAEKEFSRDFEKNFLNPCIRYINICRPLSTSMGNAIKHLKYHISQVPSTQDDETAIKNLQGAIDDFIHINITKAAEAVGKYAEPKIKDNDVILVYAASSLISHVLREAYRNGKKFRVIVVDGRPRTEGITMLRSLVRSGIPCTYVYIGSASHIMSEVTKVFLGAAAMFGIGDMHSRAGNSMIAALAKANKIPVLVCCETYKFTDKVQIQSWDSDLKGKGSDLILRGHQAPIISPTAESNPELLNLLYDVTKSTYITALVTELGPLPCTSVPVILRRQEDLRVDSI